MSQQQPQQQRPQQQTGQQYQQQQQTFDRFVPQQVSQAVYQLEQLESDAEWAHGQAMQAGDSVTAKKLADISQIVHLQKTLLLRESDLAQTVGQCTQQALQQSTQQAQQVSQTITQAASQVGQFGGQSSSTAGQSTKF